MTHAAAKAKDDEVDGISNIGNAIRYNSISRVAPTVWAYRKEMDAYTRKLRSELEAEHALEAAGRKPIAEYGDGAVGGGGAVPAGETTAARARSIFDVDHIWECQIAGHCIAHTDSWHGLYTDSRFIKPVSGVINSLEPGDHFNLNCTRDYINRSKGQVVKKYCRAMDVEGSKADMSFLPYIIGHKAEQVAGQLCDTMNAAFPVVYERLRDARRLDGHVTGSQFSDMAETLATFFERMDIDHATDRKSSIGHRVAAHRL